MTLNEMIYHRKSCRSFTNTPVDAATIETIKAIPRKKLQLTGDGEISVMSERFVKPECVW